MISIQIFIRKIIPRNYDLNLYVTKAKYSKSLQRQRTKGEIKSSFISAVIICINVSTNEM